MFYQQALKSTKAKQKFNQRTFDYKDFPKHIVKIFTDLLHGQLVKIKTKTDAIQLMVFLCFDGALIPERENPVEAQIQSSQFEWKVFRRCKNLLYGISGIPKRMASLRRMVPRMILSSPILAMLLVFFIY